MSVRRPRLRPGFGYFDEHSRLLAGWLRTWIIFVCEALCSTVRQNISNLPNAEMNSFIVLELELLLIIFQHLHISIAQGTNLLSRRFCVFMAGRHQAPVLERMEEKALLKRSLSSLSQTVEGLSIISPHRLGTPSITTKHTTGASGKETAPLTPAPVLTSAQDPVLPRRAQVHQHQVQQLAVW